MQGAASVHSPPIRACGAPAKEQIGASHPCPGGFVLLLAAAPTEGRASPHSLGLPILTH